jgi:hypothetical protein
LDEWHRLKEVTEFRRSLGQIGASPVISMLGRQGGSVIGRNGLRALLAAVLGAGACSREAGPGLGEIMTLNQMRHAKLWRAGEAQNWSLAAYELDELQEGFDDVIRFHPTHKDAPLPLSALVPKIMAEPMQGVRHAVESKNREAFVAAYDGLTNACNSCHQATNFGFNVVRRPADASWFSNQDFEAGGER